jgi:hypothetical protein
MSRLWRRETGIEEHYLEHDFESKSIYLTSPASAGRRFYGRTPFTLTAD